MILTCPACATSYFTPDDAIGPHGRRVRCQGCGEVWRATADEPLELTAAAGPISAVEDTVADTPSADAGPGISAETAPPELPRAFRARAEQQRRLRRAAAHGVVWAGLAGVFAALMAAGWLFRIEVVERFPRAAAAYAMVGAPVNPTGLDFEAVRARAAAHDPGAVLVSGALRNVRDREVLPPPVRIALLDARGGEIDHRILRLDGPPVLPGQVQGFAVLIPDPGGRGRDVGVDFVDQPPAGRRPSSPSGDAAAATPPPAPTPATRPPPPAAEGLRSALSPGPAPDPALVPRDAIPVGRPPVPAAPAQAGLRPALDSRPAEAVSAAHG